MCFCPICATGVAVSSSTPFRKRASTTNYNQLHHNLTRKSMSTNHDFIYKDNEDNLFKCYKIQITLIMMIMEDIK